MEPIIGRNREKIAALCRQHHVRRLAVFGSAVRDDFDPARSDVDFVYEFEASLKEGYASNLMSLHTGLETLLGRKVDLIPFRYIRNPFFLRRVLEEQELLYAA